MSDLIDKAEALKCLEITGDYATLNEVHERLSKLPRVEIQEDLHREREQAYMQGYEDASKKYRQPQDGDLISRQAAINCIEGKIKLPYDTDTGELWKYLQGVVDAIKNLPSASQDIPTHYANDDLIHRETARRIISSPRTQEQMLMVLASAKNMAKTGHWIEEDMFDGDVAYRCSECNELFCIIEGTPKDNEYNFCPNCGAKMEVSE